jgi:hypothetical protein
LIKQEEKLAKNKNLNYRIDNRSLKKFKGDILKRTLKEKFLLEIFIQEQIHRGNSITAEDYGIDNTGKFVEKATTSPDYKITINGKTKLYEIKSSKSTQICTFKTHNLKKYAEYNANILLFYGTGEIENKPEDINYEKTRWAIVTPAKIKLMLKNKKPYIEKLFGDKLCIQIQKNEFDDYFDSHKLTFKQV